MKVLFKNTTKYTKENCNNFIEFHTHKYGKKELIRMLLASLMLLYILIFNIAYQNWLLVLGLIALGIVIYLITNYRNEKKTKKKSKVKEFSFYFYERYIKIKHRREFERLTYFNLHKIFETDQYFYLYVDEKSSLILNKEGFEVGTPEEFAKFIKGKCPLKYKKENKGPKH